MVLADPYQLPLSQLQTEYYKTIEKASPSYQENENVTWGYRPRVAVAFWYMKDHYRQLAKQFNLPTDESQLDPSQISRKVRGPDPFFKVTTIFT